ncbi:MAG TPA: radical SAM protein [Sandaracinaceae bacterium LLY-WYZ-13_1]|nr:radical SAM protein [Sandaracinaceae bacterium LLY-WYZ-13_1]
MPDRRIALVAVDAQWRDPNGTFYSFSYGIEKLRASIRSAPDLADTEVLLLDLRSGDPEAYFEAIAEFRPTMVGLSTYIWSLAIYAELTERLRRWDPGLPIVAGGPAARRSVLELAPHRALRDRLDAIVPGEGEEVIRSLVRTHLEPGWQKTVPGLDVPVRGMWRRSGPAERPDIESYASPYQLGLAPLGKTGYVETFRGCPISCAFCQWGDERADRVHSVDYLASHLEGLRGADVPNVFFLDAAFNLSPRGFRNLVDAERRVGVLRDAVVHGHLYPTFLKDEHLAFFDSVHRVQASVGIQSFDEAVLKRLGRPFDVKRFERMVQVMRGRLDVDIELIFGLPGDSPESFRYTLERSMELGHTVKVFRCLVLPDALIERADELSIDFDPRTFELRSCEGWSPEDLEREWARVVEIASGFSRPILNDDWVGFPVVPSEERPSAGAPPPAPPPMPADAVHRLRGVVEHAADGWALSAVRREHEALLFDLTGPDGAIVLEVVPLVDGEMCFASRDGLAYSHRGPLPHQSTPGLRRVIEAVHGDALTAVGAEAGRCA